MEQSCPLPEVVEALRPYIRSRQEVDSIREHLRTRSGLTAFGIAAGSSPLSNDQPASLPSVQKAYRRALQAHQEALAKFQSLKAEVDQLARVPPTEPASSPANVSILKESYLPLLRHREKQRRLIVLERTYAKLHAAGGETVADPFDTVVRKEIGDLPTPPSSSTFPERELDAYGGPDLSPLKQAILGTKQKVDNHRRAVRDVDPATFAKADANAELQALQNAHIELTLWMERQLMLISDDDAPAESGAASPTVSLESAGLRAGEDIAALYEQYLDARERLVETVLHPDQSEIAPIEIAPAPPRDADRETEQRMTNDAILPYITHLLAMKQQEQHSLQQMSHARRQLSSAKGDTSAVLSRLADESHLVPPSLSRRAVSGQDWLEAGQAATKSMRANTMQRLEAGQTFVDVAAQSMARIKALPPSLDAL